MSRKFTEGEVRLLVIYKEKLSFIRNWKTIYKKKKRYQKTKIKPQLNAPLHVPDWQTFESQRIPAVGGEIRILMLFLLECQLIGYFRDHSGRV